MEARTATTPSRKRQHWLSDQLYHDLLARYLISSFWMGILFALTYVFISQFFFSTLLWPPLIIVLAAIILIGISLSLNWQGKSRAAAHLYFVTIFLSLFGVMAYLGGPFSVLSLTILVNLSLVAILEGRKGVLIATPLVILGVLLLSYAIYIGVIHPFPLLDATRPASFWANGLLLISDVGMELYMLLEFSRLVEMSLREAEVRGQALEEVSRHAEEIARVERDLREREAARLERLHKLVDAYVAFMERLRMGDYGVRLELPPESDEEEPDPVLHLGHQLNATAESWRQTLARVRQARDHYLLTAWSRFLEEQRWQNTTFRLAGEYVDRVQEAEAIPDVEKVAVKGGEAYLPLRMGALSLGTLVLRREGDRPWTEEELDTLEAIIAPLVQTIDNLRLVEESRNRAAREQLSSRIADRMRESLDLERVLQTAAQELGEAFGLREVVVQLAPSQENEEAAG